MFTSKRPFYYLLVAMILIIYAGLHLDITSTGGWFDRLTGFVYAADLKEANQPAPLEPLLLSELQTWEDFFEFITGIFLLILGLLAIALSLFRGKANNLLLLSFGIIGLLNSGRSNLFPILFDASARFWEYQEWFVTYLIPIPGFFFLEQLLGSGWKSSMRRLWQFAIAFAIVTIVLAGILRNPPIAGTANNIFVVIAIAIILFNLFRPGLQVTREIRILRFGIIIFALFVGSIAFTGSVVIYI